MGRGAFTLTELLTVLIVIAVMAAVAVPQYRKATERGYCRSAQDLLQTIYTGEQVYWTARATFTDPATCASPPGPWQCIYMDNPNGTLPVTFAVPASGASTFTAQATRDAGGLCAGKVMTINEQRVLGGDWIPDPACC
jgi:prepilin-type N-terminal cleavage/methylation domain-containing protein